MSFESSISRRQFLLASTAVAATALWPADRLGAAINSGLISTISVTEKKLDFVVHGSGRFRLLTFPVYADSANMATGGLAWEGEIHGEAKFGIDRFDSNTDRLFHKFRLFDAVTSKPVAGQRFVEDLRSLGMAPPTLAWPASIKGVSCPVDVQDLAELGVKHTHINLNASSLVRVDESKREDAFSRTVDGRRLYFNPGGIRTLDRFVRQLTDAGINALGVVTNRTQAAAVLTHPKMDLQHAPNHMGAFNLSTGDGVANFRGLMEFISDRYCRGNRAFGSVGGWIIGNEVQSTWEWHNMGAASNEEVAHQYADELRMAWFAVRNAGAAVPVFASFDHFWGMAMTKDSSRHHPGKALLDSLGAITAGEGNFPWHVAQHPYPENLFKPKFWNDKTATFAFDSPRVTFKNVEVLAAYLRRKELLCDGKSRRLILSEQGLHAGDTPESEQIQAAAYALAYRRLSLIPGVDAFILHRHVDAPSEGGLKLGIWPASGSGPSQRKRPIWEVVKAADTSQWQAACNFALPIIGLHDWAEAKPRSGPFPERSAK